MPNDFTIQPSTLEPNLIPLGETTTSPVAIQANVSTPPPSGSGIVPGPGGPVLTNGAFTSPNYSPGSSGWKIDANGNVEFGGGKFRGDITGSSGTFSGTLTATAGSIGGFTIASGSLSTGAFDTLNTLYFGSLGLSLSDTFKVTAAGALTAASGVIGGFTITATELYGGIIKTAATVEEGSSGVIMDSAGLRGYDSILGSTFNLPTDGSAPTFSSGVIQNTIFEINTNAILRTSDTVGDGTANSAGILINNTGLYATEANQTLANANVKILVDGSAVMKMNIKGGQTDYDTGIGYFLGLSGGDYKLSIGNSTNYLKWDAENLIIKGSFDVGSGGLINNSVYTVANLPIAPTSVGFNPPTLYE